MASLQPELKKNILDVKSSVHTRVSKQVSKLLLGILTNNEHSFSPRVHGSGNRKATWTFSSRKDVEQSDCVLGS